ncbi:MAG: aspartate carbamoyltransferase regulatory subunit [Bacteroidales bacterium]|nr:aspartate carbamoyltransferase regulatory subunit [Bacteroidales bacterium]
MKKLQVAALKEGTVIDHIPPKKLFKVITLLKLQNCDNMITFGTNLESKRMGRKAIIKVSEKFFEDSEINRITLIAPNAKINIIKNFEVVEKRPLKLPDEVKEIVTCPNPACITNHQPVTTHFIVQEERDVVLLKCHYCEKEAKLEEVKIK